MVIECAITAAAKEGVSSLISGGELGKLPQEQMAMENLADKLFQLSDAGKTSSSSVMEMGKPIEAATEEEAIQNLQDKFEQLYQVDSNELIHSSLELNYQGAEQLWNRYYLGESDGKSIFSLTSGKDVDALNGMLPNNSIIEVQSQSGNLIECKVDEVGRINEFRIENIERIDGTRDLTQQSLCRELKDGLPTDDAGHILAREFGGPTEQFNLLPMDSYVNRHGEWRLMEHDWKNALSDGKSISDVCIRVDYDGINKRPTGFEVDYKIDGEVCSTYIDNSPKQSIA